MPDCRGLWERRSREGRSVGLCEGGDRSYAGKSEPTERAMSENRPTRTYDDECPKHPVFGDCALVDGPLFGGRPNCRLQHLRPDRPHHASGSHRTEPIENADRSKRKGASRYTVLRGRSAATSALDNGDLLIEGLGSPCCLCTPSSSRTPPDGRAPPLGADQPRSGCAMGGGK